MLLSFRTANVLSIRDEQRLSLVATELNDGSARPTRIKNGGKPVSVVPVIGIYGPNASGKTNILAALRMMRTAVLTSVDWFGKPRPGPPYSIRARPRCCDGTIVLRDRHRDRERPLHIWLRVG